VTTESHHQIFEVIGHCQPAGHQGEYADDIGGSSRRHRHLHAFLILNRAEHRSRRGIDKASEHEAVDLPEPGQLRVEQRQWHACILPPGPVSNATGVFRHPAAASPLVLPYYDVSVDAPPLIRPPLALLVNPLARAGQRLALPALLTVTGVGRWCQGAADAGQEAMLAGGVSCAGLARRA
jgi:hypothetical protein